MSTPFPEQELRRLWATMARLLGPEGCPWDREQRGPDLARHLIEEGHEWLEAWNQNDSVGQTEELGDVAYLVVFGLQRLALDAGADAPARALAGIDAKLKRRHPHLFPTAAADETASPADSDDQLQVWEAVKRAEREAKGEGAGLLKPLPRSMGALAKSHRYQEKAAGAGFDWPDLAGVLAKLSEELGELRDELDRLPASPPAGAGPPSKRYRRALTEVDREGARDELGDLIFVTANLCRWLGFDAEEVAEAANAKFLRRFAAMEARLAAAGEAPAAVDLERMESAWRAVKREERES